MITIIRAEWLKMRTTAVPLVMTVVAVLVNALLIVGTFLDRPTTGNTINAGGVLISPGYAVPHTVGQLRNLLGSGFQGYILALLLGILCITTEFRHKTVTTSFLVTPRRATFVAGKLITAALLGVGLAVVMLLTSLTAGGITLAARGGSFSALADQLPNVAPGLILVFALCAVLGVGIGSVLTNQVAAITVSLGWFIVLGEIIISLIHGAERWLPTGAATAAANLTRGRGTDFGLFNPWQGGLLLFVYGLVFATLGSAILTKRDVT